MVKSSPLSDKISHLPLLSTHKFALAHFHSYLLFSCQTARRRWPALESTSARIHQEEFPLSRPSCEKGRRSLPSWYLLLRNTSARRRATSSWQRGHRTGAAQPACGVPFLRAAGELPQGCESYSTRVWKCEAHVQTAAITTYCRARILRGRNEENLL